jgi:hypothetical protein
MRVKGINYDTGFFPGGKSSRESFDADVVRRELKIIADDLHCTAVRISGGDPARLTVAGEHAAAAGLQVWFAPFPCDLTAAELVPYFADCAERAQDLRDGGADVVLVTGCELSLFAAGFIPGQDAYARIATLASPDPRTWAVLKQLPRRLNASLAEATATAREHFAGRITYASRPWEQVDWDPFDLVAVDAYRDARNATSYRHKLRRHFVHGKPVVATEFGCLLVHLRQLRAPPPSRPSLRPRHGWLRCRQDPGAGTRAHLPGHGLGAQGVLPRPRRGLRRLTARTRTLTGEAELTTGGHSDDGYELVLSYDIG